MEKKVFGYPKFDESGEMILRSEERRVGKEWRS